MGGLNKSDTSSTTRNFIPNFYKVSYDMRVEKVWFRVCRCSFWIIWIFWHTKDLLFSDRSRKTCFYCAPYLLIFCWLSGCEILLFSKRVSSKFFKRCLKRAIAQHPSQKLAKMMHLMSTLEYNFQEPLIINVSYKNKMHQAQSPDKGRLFLPKANIASPSRLLCCFKWKKLLS